jgi:hypothetical protein
MIRLAAVQAGLRRLAEATLLAWRQDRVFRGAVIGMGITLAVLLGRSGITSQDRVLPPLETSAAGTSALPNPIGGIAVRPAQAPPDSVPKIAPDHPLGEITITPVPSSDRFGTIKPRKAP